MNDLEVEIVELRETIERELTALRNQVSRISDVAVYAAASRDVSWLGFAFTVTYGLLGFILWRVW